MNKHDDLCLSHQRGGKSAKSFQGRLRCCIFVRTLNRGQGHLWSPSWAHTYCLQESAQLPHQHQNPHLHPHLPLPGGWQAPHHRREKSHFLHLHQHSHCSHPPPAQPPAAGLYLVHQGHLYHHHLHHHLLPLALLPPIKTVKIVHCRH